MYITEKRSLSLWCRTAKYLTLQLEVIGSNRCARWHQDWYAGRMIVTYCGPSTWMVDDKDVNFEMFEAGLNEEEDMVPEVTNPIIVPEFERIKRPGANSVMLIKGNLWPGIEDTVNGMGVVHKAPDDVGKDSNGDIEKRLVLKVDLSSDPPPKLPTLEELEA